ncbi:glycoside hydrolase superfamily [Chlamydoabsidia padenii]|nr:glycoside hydrolase superfamily [Chlamydoabsidia padenii]
MLWHFTIIYTLSLFLLLPAQAHDGISTPPMGWNTWNRYGCLIHEQLIKETADMIVDHGYRDAGYNYLNLDDCWQSYERTNDGYIIIDKVAFPNGIGHVADYVHSRGLKFGIYSSAGRQTCAGRMASSGYEMQDAQTYANMGVDYLKYDNCNYEEGVSAKTRYQSMAKAINATGRHIFLSVCNWGTENTWEWASQYGHSFRTHDDIYNDWKSVVEILNVHATVVSNGGPGKWADPDMLEIGNGKLTVDESRSHFSLWAAMKAPLILGHSLSNMPRELYDIVVNKRVIDINQDALGQPAKRITHIPNNMDVWAGELMNQSMVLVIINYMDKSQTFNININSYGYAGSNMKVFDLWNDKMVTLDDKRYINNLIIRPHDVAMYKLSNGIIIGKNDTQTDNTSKETKNSSSGTSFRHYEAEALDNMVYGLARRRGCLSCSGGAQVIALGKVNHPQTGSLQFRNIKVDRPGIYKLTIGYLDCFSWVPCGDYWTRRWELGISIYKNHHQLSQNRLTVALKALRQVETTRHFTLGLALTSDEGFDIMLDNPTGLGPSIDYIELEWMKELGAKDRNQPPYLYLFAFWKSYDPLVSEDAWMLRWVVDYFWEWMAMVAVITGTGYGLWLLYTHLRKQRHGYTTIHSSNSSIVGAEGAIN